MTNAVNLIVKSALDEIYLKNSTFLQSVDRTSIETELQTAIDKVIPNSITLSSTAPDFESILFRLVQELQTVDAWKDIIPSETGQFILRAIASAFTFAHYASERSLQEALLKGNSETAIYAATEMLGVRIKRNTPARVQVRLSRADVDYAYSIPRFSKFTINEISFFNRDIINFNRFDLTTDVILYQGDIFTADVSLEGIAFEKITFGDENKLISDEDVYVFIDDVEWERSLTKPWTKDSDSNAFFDRTLSNGNVEIMFGNNIYGKIPVTNNPIKIIWAENEGATKNNSLSDIFVVYEDAPSGIEISGTTLTNIYGGDTIKESSYYKEVAPYLRPANLVASKRADYTALALDYPGVIDALIQGQAELAPNKRSWMNIISATLITKTAWSQTEFDNFKEYFNSKCIFRLEILRIDPVAVDFSINAEIGCVPTANLEIVDTYLKSLVDKRFGLRKGSLGYNIIDTDVSDVLQGFNQYREMIETVKLIGDHNVEITNKKQYANLTSINLNVGYSTRNSYQGRLDLIGGNVV